MAMLSGPGWAVALLVVLLVGAALMVVRYRGLERAGSALPPGAGGVRLRGLDAVVTTAHGPGGATGTVQVLGDEWRIAAGVTETFAVGDVVRVVDVEGTALVVTRPDAADHAAPDPPARAPSDHRRET